MKAKFLMTLAGIMLSAVFGCAALSATENEHENIRKVHDFLKETKVYYLATVEGDQPRVRPFGTVLIFEGKLYIQTGRKKNVSKQIGRNPKVELCAFNGKTWLRLTGKLVDDDRLAAKTAMLDAYPGLKKMYKPDDGNTQVLYFQDAEAIFHSFGGEPVTLKF